MEALVINTRKLIFLELSGIFVDLYNLQHFCNIIKLSRSIKCILLDLNINFLVLELKNCNFDDNLVEKLMDALEINSSIISLNLSKNKLSFLGV
jgi:hypothetical protein